MIYGQTCHISALARLGGAWDAAWYTRIVEIGYTARIPYATPNGTIGAHGIPYSPRAFFPLYPGLAEPLYRILPISAGTALVIVSGAAGIAAALGIYACAAHCHGHRVGVIAAVLWGVLPLAAIENMAYSESLFTALAAWTLYAVMTRCWLWAGVLCFLAGLTRPTTMALTAAVAVAALAELRSERGADDYPLLRRRLLALCLVAPMGWVGYILWTGWVEGSWLAYFHIQDAWGSSFNGGLSFFGLLIHEAAATGLRSPFSHGTSAAVSAVMLVTLFAYLALFIRTLRRRQPLVLLAYSAALIVIDLGNASPAPPLARFLLPAFTLLFPIAERVAKIRGRWRPAFLLGAFALLSGLYGIVVVFAGEVPA
ncbi:hypothetical protein GXW82_10495 [Streptacidiphilus sp. 4-A2]|nr:hypothetical protein [Streptacidiphilus sp. 4-A2]